MNKKVIYTSIFGDGYYLHDPEVKLEGYDFICFTDNPNYKSDIWDVCLTTKIYDGVRDSKKPKILPHRYLKDYDISVWIDGDIKITADITDLIEEHLKSSNHAAFNHELCGMTTTGDLNRRNCVYDEATFIKWLGDNHPRKHYKDRLDIINRQIEKYQYEGYPSKNGLTRNTILIRRHNEPDVIKTMEKWWEEVKFGSKRDQLSFNYSAWKTNFNFTHIQEDIDNNPWFKLMKKWRQNKSKEKEKKNQPISLKYFLDMELAEGGGGKELITQNGTLKTIRDIINFFTNKENLNKVKSTLKPSNWQYFNCMLAEFRHNVEDHHKLGWENMTQEYYDNLSLMTNGEIKTFLENNPVEFDNGYIRHNYHRACAMIGRLIKGKPYIPFYMKTSQIYSEPRKKDGIHRIKPLTNKIKLLEELDKLGINRNEYCLTQSSILSIMGIRDNDDLDIIISSKLRSQNLKFPQGIEVFDANRQKFNYFGASGDDDLLNNFCIEIDGYKFLEPRFYFARKFMDKTSRDIEDWNKIKEFFEKGSHKGYPFNFEFYKWGVPFVEKIQLDSIDSSNLNKIIDKYDRVVGGVNQGRVVYHDIENKKFIKIFHPEYCRLNNFKEAIKSGFLNGLCPALEKLIYDGENIIGYICEEGTPLSNNEFEFNKIPEHFIITVLRNCKQRGKIFYDLVPLNVVKTREGQLSLIDLESVYNIGDFDKMKLHNAKIKPNNLINLINQI